MSWYQLNFQASLTTKEAGVDGKYMKTLLGILDMTGDKSKNIQYLLKVVDNKIGPIICYMDHK